MSGLNRWPSRRLDEICHIKIGRTPARAEPRYWGPGTRWLSIADMGTSRDLTDTKETVTESGAALFGDRLAMPGTVVLSFKLSIGKVGIVREPMYTNEAIAALPARKPERVEPRFLYHALGQMDLVGGTDRAVMGRTLNSAKLARLAVPLPPLAEQRRIADILDKADAIRRKRKEAIALTDELLRSAFLVTVGPLNPDHGTWPLRRIESLAVQRKGSIRSGPFGSALKHSEFVEQGIAVLGIDNAVQNRFAWSERRYITPQKYEALRRYSVFPGDVIITIMGTTGRTAVVPADIPEAITTKHLASITLNPRAARPEYLAHAVHTDPHVLRQIRARDRGAVMDGLNLGLIKELEVRLPPIHQQDAFEQQVAVIRRARQRLLTSLNDDDHLFNSLVQRAFRGEL